MAIIYSYPNGGSAIASDKLTISRSSLDAPIPNPTFTLTVAQIAAFVQNQLQSGTPNYIPVFNTTNTIIDSPMFLDDFAAPTLMTVGVNTNLQGTLVVGGLSIFNGEAQFYYPATFEEEASFQNTVLDETSVPGAAGQLLSSTGAAVRWIDPALTGVGTIGKIPLWIGTDELGDSIMTTLPGAIIEVAGDITVQGVEVNTTFKDGSGSTGSPGQVLSSTGTETAWVGGSTGTVNGTGTTDTLPLWSNGPNGDIGDSQLKQFGPNANGVYQVRLDNADRFIINKPSSVTSGDPEYLIQQDGNYKVSMGWDDDGAGFGYLYNWAGDGWRFGSAGNNPELTIVTTSGSEGVTIANDLFINGNTTTSGDLYIENGLKDGDASYGTAGQVLSTSGVGENVKWVDTTTGAFKEVNEGNGLGIVKQSRNPNNYAPVGNEAFDASQSTSLSSTKGAEGNHSVALGLNVYARGNSSFAFGESSRSFNDYDIVLGHDSEAVGGNSVAIGWESKAQGPSSTAIGSFVTASGDNSIAFGTRLTATGSESNVFGKYNATADELFVVGNGNNATPSDLIVGKENGVILAPSLDIAEILDPKCLVTLEYVSAISSGIIGTGTIGVMPVWTTATSLGDSVIKLGTGVNSLIFNDIANNIASGESSIATGINTEARGESSTATGSSTLASGISSTAMGNNTEASGDLSTAMGQNTVASGQSSVAMGESTTASGNTSTAMGDTTIASGDNSFAAGGNSVADGDNSISLGFNTSATGFVAVALGQTTQASGNSSFASGLASTASASQSTAMGNGSQATASVATAIGNQTKATGNNSTSIGHLTVASGEASTAMGYQTEASGFGSTAIGNTTIASGNNSTAMGYQPVASGFGSTAIGNQTVASGLNSIAMGVVSKASGVTSTAMGQQTSASGENSSAMGYQTEASGFNSMAMGYGSIAQGESSFAGGGIASLGIVGGIAYGDNSIAFGTDAIAGGPGLVAQGSIALGFGCEATGTSSVALGNKSIASTSNAFAAGNVCNASGNASVALGASTIASGNQSFACGDNNTASGLFSFAGGKGNQATGNGSIVMGGIGTGISTAAGEASAVFGGLQNTANGLHSTILGGQKNTIDAGSNDSSILGGEDNNMLAGSKNSILLGGIGLRAGGIHQTTCGVANVSRNDAKFVVGVGTYTSPTNITRENGFVVKDDGQIVLDQYIPNTFLQNDTTFQILNIDTSGRVKKADLPELLNNIPTVLTVATGTQLSSGDSTNLSGNASTVLGFDWTGGPGLALVSLPQSSNNIGKVITVFTQAAFGSIANTNRLGIKPGFGDNINGVVAPVVAIELDKAYESAEFVATNDGWILLRSTQY